MSVANSYQCAAAVKSFLFTKTMISSKLPLEFLLSIVRRDHERAQAYGHHIDPEIWPDKFARYRTREATWTYWLHVHKPLTGWASEYYYQTALISTLRYDLGRRDDPVLFLFN